MKIEIIEQENPIELACCNGVWDAKNPVHCTAIRVDYVVDYGLLDEKGRKVGGIVHLVHYTAETAWTLRTSGTRDGKVHGPGGPPRSFANKEQAVAACLQKIQQQQKRYIKKFT